jgi:hypothetical protein
MPARVRELPETSEQTHVQLAIPSSTVGPESSESAKPVATYHLDVRFFSNRWTVRALSGRTQAFLASSVVNLF